MAVKIPNLPVLLRHHVGKGAARQTRRDKLVPGIVYGGGLPPQPIAIAFNILFKMLKNGGFMSTLFNLKLKNNQDVRCICRGIQRDVVKDLPIHIDFLRLHRDSRVNMHIPIELINQDICVGLKAGGTLTMIRTEIELRVTAGDIPDRIEINIAHLAIGDVITISDVNLPKNTPTVISDRDFVILNITAPSAMGQVDESEDEALGE